MLILPRTTASPNPISLNLNRFRHNIPIRDRPWRQPFAIELSADDSTLVASAAASDKLFTVDANSGEVLGRVDVGAVPRGIALQHGEGGSLASAWVLNAVDNTVSFVDLADREEPQVVSTVTLEDPTHATVKRGRIAFETASASSTGTFACASCHPDGHTDQLLWVLKTPVVTGGDQIMPRSTMPIRGLRDTEPYHWDGIPGDPYGGNNSANVHGRVEPNSVVGDPVSSARHLIDGGLASTMALVDDPFKNDEDKGGRLSAAQRDDMAAFLLSVPYPPAQRRPWDSVVTERARDGFRLFHIDGDNDPSKARPNVCGNCHRMPHLVSTNTPGTGMDAPTWRGAYDRFLILPQGRLNIMEFDFYASIAKRGIPEQRMWELSWGNRERFDPVWDMVLEMSTGYSGAFARQVTLNEQTVDDELTLDLLAALETAASDGAVVLDADGVVTSGGSSRPASFRYQSDSRYHSSNGDASMTREELLDDVKAGNLIVTLTGRHGAECDFDHPQPAIWTAGPIEKQRGRQRFPVLTPDKTEMVVSGRHVSDQASVFVDGHRVDGDVDLKDDERIGINLRQCPENGMHLLQLQNPNGLFTNDFILTVAEAMPETLAQADTDDDEKSRLLGDILRRSKWDRLVGTWVDARSRGNGLKITFKWRIKDRVLESESIDPTRKTISMIAVNAQNGNVFQAGADSTGSSHLGGWTFNGTKDAVVNLGFTDGDGTQGEIALHYKFVDDDTLIFTILLPQPIDIRMVRADK